MTLASNESSTSAVAKGDFEVNDSKNFKKTKSAMKGGIFTTIFTQSSINF